MPAIRTCYTPGPAADTHLSHLRQAVFEWCLARSSEGQFVVRIDDINGEQPVAAGETDKLAALRWLNLDWDEGPEVGGPYIPYNQSERLPLYEELALVLVRSGWAYYCDCTPERLGEVYSAQQADGQSPRYDDHCRTRNLEPGPNTAIRFRLPDGGTTTINDLLRGRLEFDVTTIGDPILVKADGFPGYHLTSVADDHHMEITHVLRTDEWLSVSPIHVLLYEALGWEVPNFVHLYAVADLDDRTPPHVSDDPDSIPDSQYSEGLYIGALVERGYLPEAIFNYLALLGWNPAISEQILNVQEIVDMFSFDLLSAERLTFSLERLDWFNQQHISRLSSEQLLELLMPRLLELYRDYEQLRDPLWAAELLYCVRDDLVVLGDIATLAEFAFTDPQDYTPEALEALHSQAGSAALSAFDAALPPDGTIPPDAAEDLLHDLRREFKQSQDWNGGQVMLPVEAALTGAADELPLANVIALLNMETCHRRIQHALDIVMV